MVAGSPTQIGLSNGIGGIAEYPRAQVPGACERYIPNTIVFAFAARVLGHVEPRARDLRDRGAGDRAHVHARPRRRLERSDDVQRVQRRCVSSRITSPCGSDCFGTPSKTSFGTACTDQKHVCMSTGAATQNDVQILTALFGPAGAKAPTLKLNNPPNNSTQPPGVPDRRLECTSTDQVQEVNLSIDGVVLRPADRAAVQVHRRMPSPTDRIGSRCSARPSSRRSRRPPRTSPSAARAPTTRCAPWRATSASTARASRAPTRPADSAARAPATTTARAVRARATARRWPARSAATSSESNCPAGFGCLDSGGGNGVCWAGIESGGCCDTGGGDAGTLLLSLGFFAVLVTRRKRA